MEHLGDISSISGYDAPVVDCIIGGSPCQGLSLAGKRAGLEDERSGLFMEQIRIIKEMRYAECKRGRTGQFIRPRYAIWENVTGALSSPGKKRTGEDFAAVLEEFIRVAEPEAPPVSVPEKGWPTAGCFFDMDGRWSVAWRVLDAQFWGVTYHNSDGTVKRAGTPQRRRRIALVADYGGLTAPEILFERKGLSWDPCESEEMREGTGAGTEKGAGRSNCACIGLDLYNLSVTGDVAATVTTATGQGASNTGPSVMVPVVSSLVLDDQGGSQITVRVDGKSPTLRAEAHGNLPCVLSLLPEQQQWAVRRVTPVECERLNGYPDEWTKLPLIETMNQEDFNFWDNVRREHARIAGKKYRTPADIDKMVKWWNKLAMSDNHRYRSLGNSIALPQWKWIIKRLCSHYDRDATMGSLFDGIGGFPYLWEQINGKGMCLWASEIEPFQIAVTRRHFPN